MLNKIKKIIKEDKYYILTLIIFIIICNYRLPYYIEAPGGTININNRIEYKDNNNYKGSLNMLYVTQYEATIPIYLLANLIDSWDIESITESQISNETHEEIDKRNKIMLDNSINNAIYVAYKSANKDITIKDKKHYVVATLKEIDLKIGDEILKVNNTYIDNLEDIKNIIDNSNIGDKLIFTIKRNNKEKDIEVLLQEIDEIKGVGIVMMTNHEYETTPEITLKFKKSESGSSGGLMMSLSIYSAISGEDILRGRNIAGTGTIDNNGNVGEIAGIKYKIMGAVKDKMDIVLVPTANYKEALEVVNDNNYDIELVEVKTFEDAINYLKK